MVDFACFDSILDAAFVIGMDGKIVYCNDAAATFCSNSIRRMTGKAHLADLVSVAEPGIFPFTEGSPGRGEPSAFIETQFTVAKDGRTGKAQLAIRPVDGSHWLFVLRDVSLEEALYSKFRSELAQKEDYARNLEKLVEARTAELNAVNQTLNAILDSLGQGFFTFNGEGDCGSVFTRACADVLEGVPKGRKVWDVLGVPAGEHEQIRKWMDSLFKELLPFDDMKSLGPGLYPHSDRKHVVLEYYPIRRETGDISEVVVVATDKTAEHEAQRALEAERQYASMIVKFTKNKDQFLQFLASVRQSLKSLRKIASAEMAEAAINESFRILHTLEGEAGTFALRDLRLLSRVPQQILEPYKGRNLFPESMKAEYIAALGGIERGFEEFLRDNADLFRLPEGEVSRVVETPIDEILGFYSEMEKTSGTNHLRSRFQDTFLRVPIEDRLKYFDGLVQAVAERLNKRAKPLRIEGGALRIFPDPYSRFFPALVHAFRNAVDHGLETPEEREWAGKDPAGTIRVRAWQESGRLHVMIADDGKGIDPQAIREKLKSKFPDRDFSGQSDEDVIQNVCLPGFSSREDVGEFSGRGVGLDALREEVLNLGGSMHLESKLGEGTCIVIELPELGYETAALRSA